MELWIVLIWILWPILTYNIAKSKGYDTGAAVALGLIGGLIAVIVYASLGQKNVTVEPKGFCPKCGRSMENHWDHCPSCGNKR